MPPGGLCNRTAVEYDHLRLPEIANDFFGCVLPFGYVSAPGLSKILTLILKRLLGVRSL